VNWRRFIVIVLVTIGITSFFSSFAFNSSLRKTSPTTPVANQIYQMNEHGYLYYVTKEQYWLFNALCWGGWSLAALAAILNYRWKVVKNLTRRGWEYPT
jgi:hypothetical protein